MTCAALTKLVFLVILVFILCLPEFFTVHKVLSVWLRCMQLRLCGDEEESTEKTGLLWSNSTCPEQWEHLLRATADQRNVTQTETRCFVCQTNVNMPELDLNSSSSAEVVRFEVSFTIQINKSASDNITLFGYNQDTQLLHLSDEEEAKKAFLHCASSADTANHSCCLLLHSNRTFARRGLPWKRTTEGDWSCVLRVTWLSLLCAVLLLILLTVAQQVIDGRKHSSDKSIIHPFMKYASQGQPVMDRAIRMEDKSPMVLRIDTSGCYFSSALSSIEEVETPEETESEVFFCSNDWDGNIIATPTHPGTDQTVTTSEP